MSIIAIKDLSEDKTLDQAAKCELRGGGAGHCPKGAPGAYSPGSGQQRRDSISLDLELMRASGSGQAGSLVPRIGPVCGRGDGDIF